MIHTDGRSTIANGAGDTEKEPGKSWKLIELQAEQARLLAELERVGNEIALVLWADIYGVANGS